MSAKIDSKNKVTALTEEVDPETVKSWKVYIGREIETCDTWTDACGYMLDALKFWYGYYLVQVEDSTEKRLTWTVEEHKRAAEQYKDWIDLFNTIEDTPQEIHLLGSNRKLSIIPRKKEHSDG